jgi:hypothetical protein
LNRIKRSPKFALQIDQLTGVAGFAEVLYLSDIVFEENIQVESLFCLQLSESCTRNNVFKAVDDRFTTEDISLAKFVGLCADRAAALTGYK